MFPFPQARVGTVCGEGRRSKPKKEIGCGLEVFGVCCWEVKHILGMLKLWGEKAGQVTQPARVRQVLG